MADTPENEKDSNVRSLAFVREQKQIDSPKGPLPIQAPKEEFNFTSAIEDAKTRAEKQAADRRKKNLNIARNLKLRK